MQLFQGIGRRLTVAVLALLFLSAFGVCAEGPAESETPALAHSDLIIVQRFAAPRRIIALDPSLGFSLQRGHGGVPPAERAASVGRATAFILADTITQQLHDRGYDTVQSDETGPEPDRRALIVSGVFRSINEGHRRRFAGKDASVAVSVAIDGQVPGEKPQRLNLFQLDSRRIPQHSGRHAEAGVNSAARRLGSVIADAAAELADRNSWPRRHADKGCSSSESRPNGNQHPRDLRRPTQEAGVCRRNGRRRASGHPDCHQWPHWTSFYG